MKKGKQICKDGRIAKVCGKIGKEREKLRSYRAAREEQNGLDNGASMVGSNKLACHDWGKVLELFVNMCWGRRKRMEVLQNKRKWSDEDHQFFADSLSTLFKCHYNQGVSEALWRWCQKNYQHNWILRVNSLNNVTKLRLLMKFVNDTNVTLEESERAYREAEKCLNKGLDIEQQNDGGEQQNGGGVGEQNGGGGVGEQQNGVGGGHSLCGHSSYNFYLNFSVGGGEQHNGVGGGHSSRSHSTFNFYLNSKCNVYMQDGNGLAPEESAGTNGKPPHKCAP